MNGGSQSQGGSFRSLTWWIVLVLLILLIGVPVWAAWQANKPEAVKVSGKLQSAALTLHVPSNTGPIEIGPPEPGPGLRLIGVDVSTRGLEGVVDLPTRRVRISRDTAVMLRHTDSASYVDVVTKWPLTISVEPGHALDLKIVSAPMLGDEFGLGHRTLTAAEFTMSGRRGIKGAFHASNLTIARVHGMLLAGPPVPGQDAIVDAIRLTSPSSEERTGPVGFAVTGGQGKIRVLLDAAGRKIASVGMRAYADALESTDSNGRLVVGARSITLSGFEGVDMSGSLLIRSVEIASDQVGFRIDGTVSRASLGGESVLPTALEQLTSQPLYTVIYGTMILVWGGLVQMFIRFLFAGKWNGG